MVGRLVDRDGHFGAWVRARDPCPPCRHWRVADTVAIVRADRHASDAEIITAAYSSDPDQITRYGNDTAWLISTIEECRAEYGAFNMQVFNKRNLETAVSSFTRTITTIYHIMGRDKISVVRLN